MVIINSIIASTAKVLSVNVSYYSVTKSLQAQFSSDEVGFDRVKLRRRKCRCLSG